MKFQSLLKNAVSQAPGSSFLVTKNVVATAVLTTATNLTTAATGRLFLKNIILDTDSTGLNSTVNAFTINVAGNTFGATALLSQVTSALGANVSLSFLGATPTTYKGAVIDAGANLTFQVATAAATGVGKIRMTLEFVRLDENAQCVAA